MPFDQLLVFVVLAITLVLFVWNRWRYDLVALFALLVVALAGIVPLEGVFVGLGHPAVVTVAAVLVISRGLSNAGVVAAIAQRLTKIGNRPWLQVAVLTSIVAIVSGFMNNVGALALFMPVAIGMSRQSGGSPSLLLMPLAFGSLLGGTLSLIGTPPNIIIASYRRDAGGDPFSMFDFLPVGVAITVAGVLFITAVGWRLTPQRKDAETADDLFAIEGYVTELRLREDSKYVGQTLHALLAGLPEKAELIVIARVRDGDREPIPSMFEVLRANDLLLVEADSDSLKAAVDGNHLELGSPDTASLQDDEGKKVDLHLREAVIMSDSMLVGSTAAALSLRERFHLNLLAVARQGRRLRSRVKQVRFVAGDILLLQGDEENIQSAMSKLGCLPLEKRELQFGRPRRIVLAVAIFAAATALIALDVLPAALALVSAALLLVLTGVVAPREIYESIDMPVIILLAAMLPIGEALESTGGTATIAEGVLSVASAASPPVTVAFLMVSVMLLSNVINNAAAAVLAAPIAIRVAEGLQVSVDPLLMAVAVGASCAFLTPIGHQSNTLVMEPGGYRFADYWRLGLPLSVLVVVVAVPVILLVWPL